jgi:hypothetical protein
MHLATAAAAPQLPPAPSAITRPAGRWLGARLALAALLLLVLLLAPRMLLSAVTRLLPAASHAQPLPPLPAAPQAVSGSSSSSEGCNCMLAPNRSKLGRTAARRPWLRPSSPQRATAAAEVLLLGRGPPPCCGWPATAARVLLLLLAQRLLLLLPHVAAPAPPQLLLLRRDSAGSLAAGRCVGGPAGAAAGVASCTSMLPATPSPRLL